MCFWFTWGENNKARWHTVLHFFCSSYSINQAILVKLRNHQLLWLALYKILPCWKSLSSSELGTVLFSCSFVPVLQRRCHQIVRAPYLPHPSHYWNEINGNSMKTATQAGEKTGRQRGKGEGKTECGWRSWQGGELGQLPFLRKCQKYNTT